MVQLKHLFEPLKVGPMEIKNRVVTPAMDPGFGIDDDGCVTPAFTEFVLERARSEPGMIIMGAICIHPLGTYNPDTIHSVPIWEDRVLPSLEEIVKAVRQCDTKFGAQLNHAGLNRLPHETVCATVVPEFAAFGDIIRAATTEEVREYVQAFGEAAARCAALGFDFVEVHGAHSYLINEFLSPHFNQRTDEYGGSFENRIRFLLEVVREIRKKVGDGFPVGVRLPADDFIGETGWRIDDLCKLAPVVEKEGADYISVSQAGAAFGTMHVNVPPMYEEQGAFVGFAE